MTSAVWRILNRSGQILKARLHSTGRHEEPPRIPASLAQGTPSPNGLSANRSPCLRARPAIGSRHIAMASCDICRSDRDYTVTSPRAPDFFWSSGSEKYLSGNQTSEGVGANGNDGEAPWPPGGGVGRPPPPTGLLPTSACCPPRPAAGCPAARNFPHRPNPAVERGRPRNRACSCERFGLSPGST
jgi:hypothetical protein